MKDRIIYLPDLGNYTIHIKYLINHLTKYKVIISEGITTEAIELGNNYSPKYASNKFKYDLGNMIIGLNNGANTIIQIDDGYYTEVQEKILSDLGYLFNIYNFKLSFKSIYKLLKNLDKDISIFKMFYYIPITLLKIRKRKKNR